MVVCGGAPVVPDAPETTEPDTEVFRPLWTEPPGLPGDGGGGGIGDWDMTYELTWPDILPVTHRDDAEMNSVGILCQYLWNPAQSMY